MLCPLWLQGVVPGAAAVRGQCAAQIMGSSYQAKSVNSSGLQWTASGQQELRPMAWTCTRSMRSWSFLWHTRET